MGKPTGFLEYEREDRDGVISPKERIQNFNEFHIPLSSEDAADSRAQDVWTAVCRFVSLV